ncbi:MAG TPA: AAA family ATPase, partial [Candidatus Saccharimonadaceae bacterium]|nr:AAA family ATPase [Candidatus Saccharimonadaceae bacterium]
MSLVLHPSLTQTIVELRRDLPQSLLLSGEKGAGLGTLARDLASQQLVQIVKPTDKDGVADELNGSISITEIRSLYESTRGKSKARRVIIIDDADRMTHSAQNAFLKLLEEPPELVHFILTAHSVEPL